MRISLLMLALSGCGGGEMQQKRPDMSSDASEPDTAVDAKPPNVTHLGTVQGSHVGSNNSSGIGFYDVPSASPGCTWRYAGNCSLQTCAASSGLVPASAGVVTLTVNATPLTSTPNGTTYPGVALPSLDPGTMFSASAAGDTVPAFTSKTLVVPSALTGIQPADASTIPKNQPLMVTWTPADGSYYVNISQQTIASPYPAMFAETLRCIGSSQAGSVTIDPMLLASFDTSMQASLYVAALVSDDVAAGDYDITVRVLAVDAVRKVTFQ